MPSELVDYSYNNKINLVLLTPLLIVFFMCMIDLTKTKYLFSSLFNHKYFYKYPHDSVHIFSAYKVLIFLYLSFIFALLLMFLQYDNMFIYEHFFKGFGFLLCLSMGYFLAKYLLSVLLYNLSNKKTHFKQMLILETSYLSVTFFSILLLLYYAFLHLNNHDFLQNYILAIALITYFIRFFAIVLNNKKLLSGEILYIILYLCALEILPFIYCLRAIID